MVAMSPVWHKKGDNGQALQTFRIRRQINKPNKNFTLANCFSTSCANYPCEHAVCNHVKGHLLGLTLMECKPASVKGCKPDITPLCCAELDAKLALNSAPC